MVHCYRFSAAPFLWAVLLFAGFASQTVAQDTVAPPVQNSLPYETISGPRRAQPKVIIIDTTPDIDQSEDVRRLVEALEKEGRAKRSDVDRVGKPVELEAILSPVHDMPHEKVVKLIEVLKSLGVDRIRFVANIEQKTSTVILQCPANVTWRKVRTMTDELEKTEDFKVDVRVAASDEPVTPVAVGSLPNANRVQPILPDAEELPPPSKLQDGFNPLASRPAPETSERGELKVFSLQNIQAKEAGRIIEQLYITTPGGHDSFAIRLSVDDRNNSLIVRGDSAVIAEVEALVLRLDTKQPETDPGDRSTAIGGAGTGIRVNVPALGPDPLAVDFSMPGGGDKGKTYSFYIGFDGQSAGDLQRQYEALEQRAKNLSDELRKPLPDPGKGDELKTQLRDVVKQAFEARQRLQRAELAAFAQRMKAIDESIESREKISQQIIDRRVEELLDPNLKWDEPDTNSGKTPALRSVTLSSRNETTTPLSSRRATTTPTPHLQNDVSHRTPNQDEKAIGKLVLTFFQDRSRRAVPCVVVRINKEFFAVTTSPATVVPDGTPHAIDRSVVEWGDGSEMTVLYDERSTKELQLYRFADDAAIPEPMRSAVEIMIVAIPTVGFDTGLEIGVPLTALTLVGSGSHSETPARVSAVNVSQKLTLPSHKVEHHYDGLFAVDVSLPEGTPVFLDGKLMGLTILGSRFVGEEAQRSYAIPASQLWKKLRNDRKVAESSADDGYGAANDANPVLNK